MLELDSIKALGLPSLLGKPSWGRKKGIRGGLDGNAVRNEVTPERRGKVEIRTRRSQGWLCPTAWGLCLGIGKPKWAEDSLGLERKQKQL